MTFKVFPFGLYKGDQSNRKFLEKHYRKELMRHVDFSVILRHLMDAEVMRIKGQAYVEKEGKPYIVSLKEFPSRP